MLQAQADFGIGPLVRVVPQIQQFFPSLDRRPRPYRGSTITQDTGEAIMLDHVSIGVADLSRTKRFYDKALGPLGYSCLSATIGSMRIARRAGIHVATSVVITISAATVV